MSESKNQTPPHTKKNKRKKKTAEHDIYLVYFFLYSLKAHKVVEKKQNTVPYQINSSGLMAFRPHDKSFACSSTIFLFVAVSSLAPCVRDAKQMKRQIKHMSRCTLYLFYIFFVCRHRLTYLATDHVCCT